MTENKNIYQRILAVTADVGTFAKDGKNTFHNYNYASIEAIVADIQPVLIKHGVVLAFEVDECIQVQVRQFTEKKGWNENEVTRVHIILQAINADTPDDKVSKGFYGFGIDSQDKGIYKATSGARKYGIFGMFNLMAGDDDPESTGSQKNTKANAQPRPAAQPQQTQRKAAPASTAKANPKLQEILFPGLAEWPPQNDKGYAIAIGTAGKLTLPCSDPFRGKLRGEFAAKGYGSDEDRRSLMAKLYSVFGVPKENRHQTSNPKFSTGHAFFFMNILEHANFCVKEADDPLPWETDAPEAVEGDVDSGAMDKEPIDLSEDPDLDAELTTD